MSDVRVVASQYSNVPDVTDGNFVAPRSLRDGTLAGVDWRLIKIMEGRGFHVTIGAFSTPIVGGGDGTVLDIDQPEGVISVPEGTAIIPIRIDVQCQTPLLATDADESEILIAVDRASANAGDGTATAETVSNMRTDNPRTSSCTCTSAYTADTTDPVLGIELARSVITGDVQGTAATIWWGKLRCLYEPIAPPILMGPCGIYIYWGGTVATSGFAQVQWLEFDETEFS